MFMHKARRSLASLAMAASVSLAPSAQAEPQVGTFVTEGDLAKYFSIPPSGAGLPPGSGTAAKGAEIYEQRCGYCHGAELEGIKAMAGPPLAGGRGTLTDEKPIKSVESYWPHATTLFDYIWRAMPFDQPGSLSADEVYSLVAYILSKGDIIQNDQVMDAKSLPNVKLPNADNFYSYMGSDLSLYSTGKSQIEKSKK